MKKILVLPLLLLSFFGISQTLYNPQDLYDSPTGLFDTDSLRTISINFYDSNYDAILQSAWTANSGLRLPATVQLSNGIFLDSVMVRYKGNSTYSIPQSFGNPKLPLNLDMNDVIGGQKLMNYKKVKLANAMFDPTFVKELSAFNIYRKYLPTSQGSFMNVKLQGNYLGLYVNTESVDKQFLKKHFDKKKGILFKCDPVQQFNQPGPQGNSDLTFLGTDSTLYYDHYDLKSDYGWTELVNLITTLNSNPNEIDSILNVDRVLWAFAANQVIANLDVYDGLYQHNYYLYQTEDGLFQMIPWDLSESFVGALLSHHTIKDSLYYYDPYYGYNCYWYPLITQLISNPNSEYAKTYSAHLRTIINESLDSTTIKNYTTYLQNIAATSASTDPNKFWGMTEYYDNVDNEFITFGFMTAGILSTVTKRNAFLQSHPKINKIPPSISNVQIIDITGTKYVTANISNEDSVQLRTTTSIYNSKFQNTTMYDDGTNGDLIAGDQVYTSLLPHQLSGLNVKFYVRAFNTDAIKLNPERAEYEFYIYTPTTDINFLTTINQRLTIFPNPTQSQININSIKEIKNIKLYTIYGKLVFDKNINSTSYNLDLSNQSAGFYIIKIDGVTHKIQKIN
ncbi:MAG: hypothetical protein COB15_14195 [Flavobacteriales bacterium]|nr:MAG: hypothetical protein COB15_14195 [Flavobacteriales bacterium]